MNKKLGQEDPRLWRYISEVYHPEDDLLADVRSRQQSAGMPDIQVAALDARHLEVLALAAGTKKAVEIGTLGGYSGVALLRGMGEGGVLHTFELEDKHAEVARETFRKAGFAEQATVHVGRASEKLRDVEGLAPFDLVFIDADKTGYPDYLAWTGEHLRLGGLVLADNAFLFGKLPDVAEGDSAASIAAMQRFHRALADPAGRFRATVLPTGEGLALGVKVR